MSDCTFCPECAHQYFTNWKSTGLFWSFRSPTIEGDKVIFDMPYPFLFIALAEVGPLPEDDEAPFFPNSFWKLKSNITPTLYQQTYFQLLQTMWFAMVYANRDVDNPDGYTQYLEGDFPGYFKNLLNNQLYQKNHYEQLGDLMRIMALMPAFSSAATSAALFNGIMSTDIWSLTGTVPNLPGNFSMIPAINRRLMGAPGKYSLTLQDLSPIPPPPDIPFDWDLLDHTIGIENFTGPLVRFSSDLIDPSAIQANYLDITESFISIRNNTGTTVYGSQTIPCTGTFGLPLWEFYPGDPIGAIISWLQLVIELITGDSVDGDNLNTFYNNGVPIPGSNYAIGLNNITTGDYEDFPNYLGIIMNGSWNFGTLNLPVSPTIPGRYYDVFINFKGESATDLTFWDLPDHSCYNAEFFSAAFFDVTVSPPPAHWHYDLPINAYFWIYDASNDLTIYGSNTVPYVGAQPDWAAYPDDPNTAIREWLKYVMFELTGDPRVPVSNLYQGTCGADGQPPCTYGVEFMPDLGTFICIDNYYGQTVVMNSVNYQFGNLNLFTAGDTNRYVQIRFSQVLVPAVPATPYAQGLWDFDQDLGIENLHLLTLELKPIQ